MDRFKSTIMWLVLILISVCGPIKSQCTNHCEADPWMKVSDSQRLEAFCKDPNSKECDRRYLERRDMPEAGHKSQQNKIAADEMFGLANIGSTQATRFATSCLDYVERRHLAASPYRMLLKSMANQRDSLESWVPAAWRRGLATSSLFTIEIAKSLDSAPIFVLKRPQLILDSPSNYRDTEKIRIYRERSSDMLNRAFDATSSAINAKAIDFEVKLARLLESPTATQLNRTRISSLDGEFTSLDLSKIISSIYGSEVDLEIDIDFDFFKSLDSLLAQTNHDAIFRYLEWYELATSSKHLSHEWFVDYTVLMKLAGKRIAGSDLPRRCVGEVKVHFSVYAAHLIAKDSSMKSGYTLGKTMAVNAKSTLAKTIEGAKFTPKLKERLLWKIDAFQITIGFPEEIMSESTVDAYYHDLDDMKLSSYYQNIYTCRSWKNKRDLQDLHDGVLRFPWTTMLIAGSEPYRHAHGVVIPMGLLYHSSPTTDLPHRYIYGEVGFVIARELGYIFGSEGRRTTPDGIDFEWAAEDEAKYQQFTGCLEKHSEPDISEGQVDDMIADNIGLDVVSKMYRKNVAYRPEPLLVKGCPI